MTNSKFDPIQTVIGDFSTYSEVLKYLNLKNTGKNYNALKAYIQQCNLNTDHFVRRMNKLCLIDDAQFSLCVLNSGSLKSVCKKLNLNYESYFKEVQLRMLKLNLSFDSDIKKKEEGHWSNIELNLIQDNYNKISLDELCTLLPNRTKTAIKLMGRKMGLFALKPGYFSSNISKLLDDSLQTYYWIGFIFADGSVHENKRLKIGLAHKDEQHLDKFISYIDYKFPLKRYQKSVEVSIMNVEIIAAIVKKFDFKNKKTYNPPCMDIFARMSDCQFLSFLIGFIDGDGHINSRLNIIIKCHVAWGKNFIYFTQRYFAIYGDYSPVIKKDKNGYLIWAAYSNKVFYNLHSFADKNKLPFLKRKWN